jgi:LPS export ABC transporter protein LptC
MVDIEKLPDESSKNVKIIYSDSGIIRAVLYAPKIDVYHQQDTPFAELPLGMDLRFYEDSLREDSRITSNYAIRYLNTGLIIAKENVEVINTNKEKLNTEYLVWDEEKQLIYTHEFVTITTEDEMILGTGMEADQEFTKYTIKNIKGTFQIEADTVSQ